MVPPSPFPLPRLQLPGSVVLMFSRDFLKGFKKLASSGFAPLLEWKDGNLPGRSPGYQFALQPSNRWDFLFHPHQRSRPSTPTPLYPSLLTPLSHSLPPSLSSPLASLYPQCTGRKLPHNEYSTSKLEYGRRRGPDRPLKYSPSFINAATCGRCTACMNSCRSSCRATGLHSSMENY